MTEFLTSNLGSGIIGAMIGAFLGAFISNWLTTKNDRIKLTMEFHKEWNSYEMSLQRRLGYHCIKLFPDSNYTNLTSVDEKGSLSIFTVLRFYERLWHCFDTDRIDKQLTATLFYKDFYWWYFISFSTSLKASQSDWPVYKDMESLKIKFREYTSEGDFQIYERKYNQKYIDYVASKPSTPAAKPITQSVSAINISGTGNFVIT